jgi:nucleoside-diphosphate-sugar epimerase
MVLITGATGAVGPSIVAVLNSEGYQIRTLSLDSPPKDLWPRGVDSRIGDITDQAIVRSAMQGIDSVIHLAALLNIDESDPQLREKYEEINVKGTEKVVKAAVHENVRRIVFFSSIAVYGDSKGRVLHEGIAPQPYTFYAKTKLHAEQIVLSTRNSSGQLIGTVLRLAAVYGSRIKGNYSELLKELVRGRFIPIGRGQNRRTLIFDKDVGYATVLALSHPSAEGRVFNLTDGEFHTLNEIIETMCSALDRRPPRFFLPVAAARSMAGILENGARLVGRFSPITRIMFDKYTEDIAVSGNRIQEELGFIPKYDLKTGWREAILEMRESGIL